jgi:hypothetical protein
MCACALVFPAFYERLNKGSFGSFVSKAYLVISPNDGALKSESGTELHVKVKKSDSVRTDSEL